MQGNLKGRQPRLSEEGDGSAQRSHEGGLAGVELGMWGRMFGRWFEATYYVEPDRESSAASLKTVQHRESQEVRIANTQIGIESAFTEDAIAD